MKILRVIALILFLSTSLFAQNKEWKPISLGDSLHTQVLSDRAIWEKVEQAESPLFKSSLIYQEQKPLFYNTIKPKVLPQAKFEQIPLTELNQIKCDGDFLFRDNSTSRIKYLDKAHGFFSESVYALVGDKKGSIYFGSEENGLGKFNGDFIQLLAGDSSFSLRAITFLFIDSQERLWVGTKDKVGFIQENKLNLFKIKERIFIKGIEEDYKGNIWISTVEEGAFCLGKSSVLQYKEGLPTHELRSVAVQKDGKIWFALSEKVIAFVKNDSLFGYPIQNIGAATRFYRDDEKLWICTSAGYFLQQKNDSLFKVNYDKLDQPRTTYACFRNDLGLWFSVYGWGVYLIEENGIVRRFSEENGLSDNHIVPIIPDQFGNVWAGGLFKGISRIEELIFQKVNNPYLIGRCGEIEKYKDDMWYFINGGKTTVEREGVYWNVSNAGDKNMPLHRHFTDGIVVDSNEAWLGGWSVGIGHLKEKEFTYYRVDKEGSYDQVIRQVQIDSLKNVFGISLTNKLYVLRGNQIYDLSKTFLVKGLKFYTSYKSSSGLIYVLSNKGVLVLMDGSYKFLNNELTEQNGNIQQIKEVGTSIFLFGDSGIQEIDEQGELLKFYKTDQLKNNSIRSVDTIADNIFMICMSNGLLSIDISRDSILTRLYDNDYGLALLDFEYLKNVNGKLLISGVSGLYDFNSKFKKQVKRPPLLALNDIQLNKKKIRLDQLSAIDQESDLEFIFSAISWGTSNQIEYKLIEKNTKEKKWRKSELKKVHFAGLSFGHYELLVRASNLDGESNIFTASFSVEKKWYQSIWFKFFIGLLGFLGIAFFFKFRSNRALKIQKKLEIQVSEKTTELQLEKEELAKQLHDNGILLKEVHHRVKNNMQMVSSLLELQSDFTEDDFAKQVLKEGNDRINALAFAHQALYQNEDYENIGLKEYFSKIINHLLVNTGCKTTINIPDDFVFNIEKGQVLGFIINELIVNSLKYAWTNSTKPKQLLLSLTLHETEIVFVYKDNGVGFPKDFSIENRKSLGYTLIPSFVNRQLKGALRCTNDNGAKIKLTFPV